MAFHGAFIFRKQDHGILSSTYFNNGDFNPYPETAKLVSAVSQNPSDPFAGEYVTVWLEDTTHDICDLTIMPEGNVDGVYKLTWISRTGNHNYEGYGMIENSSLVGFYYFISQKH